jgi:thiopurine S-methyltransferase
MHDTRPRYAQHTSSLLTSNAEQLVISLEYDQAVCDGPLFSIDAAEIQNYWPRLNLVAAIDDIENVPPKFLEAGLDVMHEVVWRTS